MTSTFNTILDVSSRLLLLCQRGFRSLFVDAKDDTPSSLMTLIHLNSTFQHVFRVFLSRDGITRIPPQPCPPPTIFDEWDCVIGTKEEDDDYAFYDEDNGTFNPMTELVSLTLKDQYNVYFVVRSNNSVPTNEVLRQQSRALLSDAYHTTHLYRVCSISSVDNDDFGMSQMGPPIQHPHERDLLTTTLCLYHASIFDPDHHVLLLEYRDNTIKPVTFVSMFPLFIKNDAVHSLVRKKRISMADIWYQ